MATVTVTTESYVEVPNGVENQDAVAEAVVKEALEAEDAIYLVKVTRTAVLLERA